MNARCLVNVVPIQANGIRWTVELAPMPQGSRP